MFSSTTIASSITMPMTRARASSVNMLSVRCSTAEDECADQGDRNRQRRDDRGTPIPQEDQHHEGCQEGSDEEVLLHSPGGRDHVLCLVPGDAEIVPGGKRGLQAAQTILDVPDDPDGIRA